MDYVQLHADSSEEERARVEDPTHRDALAVVFMTSSASRGLSFPRAIHLLIDVPRYQVETNLMEIVQVLYRGRGGPEDLAEKAVTFYLAAPIYAREGRRAAAVREGVLDLLTMLALLKLCLLSRIHGAARLRDRAITLVPIAGKAVGRAGQPFHLELADFARALARELHGPRAHDRAVLALQRAVGALLEATIQPPRVEGSFLALYDELAADAVDRTHPLDHWLVSDRPMQEAYVLGGLLLVPAQPLGAEPVATRHHLDLGSAIAYALSGDVDQALGMIMGRPHAYGAGLAEKARAFRHLRDELRAAQRSQHLEHRGAAPDGYYVLPIAAFVAGGTIARLCEELAATDDPADLGALLKDTLYAYVADSYPIETVLPLGSRFRRFPFLMITSHDLAAMRRAQWHRDHVFVSRELNLLGLLLAEAADPATPPPPTG